MATTEDALKKMEVFTACLIFSNLEDFPSKKDNLEKVELASFAGLKFASLNPKYSLNEILAPIKERLSFLDLDNMEFRPELSKSYNVNAHWALYCENYLEGFHVPFVHPALEQSLDFSQYSYELFDHCNLQIGVADADEPHFELPKDHKDYGKKIYGYYFWAFPNMMFNFYPWGLFF